jgi:hypothetical protein
MVMTYPNPNEENDRGAAQPRGEPGVDLDDLEDGSVLEVETKHHRYTLVKTARTQVRISGHPKFCPEPVTVEIDRYAAKELSLRPGYISRGMHLVFEHPVYHTVTTSRILDIHKLA